MGWLDPQDADAFEVGLAIRGGQHMPSYPEGGLTWSGWTSWTLASQQRELRAISQDVSTNSRSCTRTGSYLTLRASLGAIVLSIIFSRIFVGLRFLRCLCLCRLLLWLFVWGRMREPTLMLDPESVLSPSSSSFSSSSSMSDGILISS